jgi:DNA-binding response OmpR family regulator
MARILITDDEAPMRDMLASALRAAGHTVVEATNARQALALHTETPVDLFVTDLVMKDMDGTELLRRLRAMSPQTPVIAMSGNKHSTIYLNMAKLLGAQHMLAKPFEMGELVATVERLLAPAAEAEGGR